MKKILIAGVSGVLGKQIFQTFKSNYNISGIVRKNDFNEDSFITLDLIEFEKVNYFAKKCQVFDCLIFLVGLAHKKGKDKDFSEFYKVNFVTLKNLLSCLEKENKVPSKIIFASTISVYGEKMKTDFYYEDSIKTPSSPYAITKRKTEKYLKKYYPKKSYILRLAPVYASNFNLNINRRTNLFSFYYKVGKGKQKLSLCNIDNILTVLEGIIKDRIPVGVYNISDKFIYDYNDLLNYVNSKFNIKIPAVLIWILYYFGKYTGSNFLLENTTKLLSNNIYPSEKIRNYIELNNTLYSSNNL